MIRFRDDFSPIQSQRQARFRSVRRAPVHEIRRPQACVPRLVSPGRSDPGAQREYPAFSALEGQVERLFWATDGPTDNTITRPTNIHRMDRPRLTCN